MPKPPTRRSAVYGKKTPAPSMRFDRELLAASKAMAAKLDIDYTEYTERALKLYTLLIEHQGKAPVIYHGVVSGQWFCELPDHEGPRATGPDPLAALEAALKEE